MCPLETAGELNGGPLRRKIEAKLQESEERFRRIFEDGPIGILVCEPNYRVLKANKAFCELLGYAEEELVGRSITDLTYPEDIEKSVYLSEQALRGEIPLFQLEKRYVKKNGDSLWVNLTATVIKDRDGKVLYAIGMVVDITKRKLVEERLKASLREKETLFRELCHRTKNNMQVISNLIDLQVLSMNDQQALSLFKDTQNRIKSMALVHEKLYQSKDLSNLNLKDYIGDLADAVLESYQLSSENISLQLDVESIYVSIDTATPCGLIINELMSNSLKHAFPGGRRGEISLILRQKAEGELDLRFSDNGVGLPRGFDLGNTRSLGLTLVKNLSEKQLKGTIEVRTGCPTEFHITFKEPLYTNRV
ncbi:MAG: sensor histidine kinase [Chloroflexota bacterium]